MTEAEWMKNDDVYDMVEHIDPAPSARKVRLLGCACIRWAWEWGLDEPAPKAVHVAEAFADGLAVGVELNRVAAQMGAEWRECDEPWRPYPRTCELTEALTSPDSDRAWLGEFHNYAAEMNIADEPEWLKTSEFVRDIFGNPFRPVAFDAAWRTTDVMLLAQAIYE
jgi:hypothetical protein